MKIAGWGRAAGAVLIVFAATPSFAGNRAIRVDDPGKACQVWSWALTSDPNSWADGNADLSQNSATFFNTGTATSSLAAACYPANPSVEPLPLESALWNIWLSPSQQNSSQIEAQNSANAPNPASNPGSDGLPTSTDYIANNATLYMWSDGSSNALTDVIVWNLPVNNDLLPNGGVEIEFDNPCVTSTATGTPWFIWNGVVYTYTGGCSSPFDNNDLLIDNVKGLVGYVLYDPGFADNNSIVPGVDTNWTVTPISAPAGVTSTVASGVISLSWNPAPAWTAPSQTLFTAPTSYILFSSQTSGGENLAVPCMTGLTATNVSGLPSAACPGPYYTVAAVYGAAAVSMQSAEVNTSPPMLNAPTSGAASVTLSWTSVPGALTYNVLQGTSPGGESNSPVASAVTGTSYQVTGLAAGQTYYFKLSANYSSGSSLYSNEVQGVVLPGAPALSQPTAGSGSIALSWNSVPGATSYAVLEGTTAGGEAATPIATGLTGTTYNVTSLNAGQAYYFEVYAINAGGKSPNSNEGHNTVLASAPILASPTAADGSVSLSWTASTGATSYNIYQGTSSGGEGATAATSTSGTTITVSGLTNGQAYYFKVAAVDAGGLSSPSNEVSATPTAPPPPASKGGGGELGLLDLLAAALLLAVRAATLARARAATRRVSW